MAAASVNVEIHFGISNLSGTFGFGREGTE